MTPSWSWSISSLSLWLVELPTHSPARPCAHPLSPGVPLVGRARVAAGGCQGGQQRKKKNAFLQALHAVTTEQKDCHKMM